MSKRVSPTFIVPAVMGAALAAYLLTDRGFATAAAPAPARIEATSNAASPPSDLPPNHPAVPGGSSRHPHASGAMPNGENQKPPSIDWKVPSAWQTLANPNPMRLATYRAGDGVEVSVARAGGAIDANVLRWSQQFDGAPAPERAEKQVHGLRVTTVHVAGTFQGGGTGMAAPEKHEGWAMLAAIVEGPGAPYFFKLVGPATEVDRARPSFDALVASVAPRAAVP